MLSGLLMMFAIYGLVMTIGARVDESTAWIGNLVMGGTCAVLMLVVFTAGMTMRKKAQARIEHEIEREFNEQGFVEATSFAELAGVSLDDARDQLDKRMRERGWQRTELEKYNAIYRR